MKKIVVSCLLLVASCSCYAQLADQLPDTLSKKKICGTYVMAKGSMFSEYKIKSNNTFSIERRAGGNNVPSLMGTWEIKHDTLFFNQDGGMKGKLVMHNGSLHFINKDGSCDPAALMTKKDYKFYQRQCRQSGK